MSYTISDMQEDILAWAKAKGWTEKEVTIPEQVALIHSEISEALEAFRDGIEVTVLDEKGKPQGVYSEYADAVIRIMHYCALAGVSLEEEISKKMAYNWTREHRHGGKRI